MQTYDVNLQVRVPDVFASSEDDAVITARAQLTDALGPHVEVEPDEVLQTPADVLRAAATELHQARLRRGAVDSVNVDSTYVLGYVAGLEEAVATLHDLADAEEHPEPDTGPVPTIPPYAAPAMYVPPPDPYAEAHDAANGPTAQWDFHS